MTTGGKFDTRPCRIGCRRPEGRMTTDEEVTRLCRIAAAGREGA